MKEKHKSSLVSVVMITYNHEKYIRQAIEGVLMQEYDFDVELIVADDNSPDHTETIVQEIINQNPRGHWIKYTKHTINKGVMPNFIWALNEAGGEYIALCEGDDYWIDPFKLKKQIDFLENNPDFLFSMGRVDMLIEKTGRIKKRKDHVNPHKKETYTLKDYLKFPFSQTSSFVFRNFHADYPTWFSQVHAGDQSLVVLKVGFDGKIKYHRDLFSIYRKQERSVSHTRNYSNIIPESIFVLDNLNEYTNHRYRNILELRKIAIKWKYHNKLPKVLLSLWIRLVNGGYRLVIAFL